MEHTPKEIPSIPVSEDDKGTGWAGWELGEFIAGPLTHSLKHSLTHSLTFSLTHSLTPSHTHSHTTGWAGYEARWGTPHSGPQPRFSGQTGE